MIKSKQKAILLFLVCGIFSSCTTVKKSQPIIQKGETVIEQDAKPPINYKPNFINNVDIFRIDTSINYAIKVINTEVDRGKVRIFFKLLIRFAPFHFL